MRKRLAILASGDGSLTEAILEATQSGLLEAHIVAVISDQPQARVIERAKRFEVPTIICQMKAKRSDWDEELYSTLLALKVDLVVCAGFMRVLSRETVKNFAVVNSHPALLPLFPGAHPVRDAIAAGAKETGTTIHWVDEGVDTGEIIVQERIQILPSDTQENLHERIKDIERRLYVETLIKLLQTLEPSHGAA